MKKPDISFFCPAYYDEGNIEKVVRRAVETFDRIAGEYEVVIVEDGSPDRTGEKADELAGLLERVKAVHHKKHIGYGQALKTGFREAGSYPLVCFTDGDNQFDIAQVEKMIPLLNHVDLVIGYRINQVNPPIRVLISRIYNILVRFLFGVPFKDISCSLKIFRRDVINAVSPECNSPFIDAEIVLKANKKKFKIGEVGINTFPRYKGRSTSIRPKNFFGTIYEMLRLWWKLRLGA